MYGLGAATIVVAICAAIAFATGDTADRLLGQHDFTHQTPNLVDAKGLYLPESVAIDASSSPNRIYVSDHNNNRVLGWKDASSFSNGAPADLVIGQPDFISSGCVAASASSLCGPGGVAVDPWGNLYVSDSSRSRVLEYTNPFAACNTFPCLGGPASMVFGQASFTGNRCNSDGETCNGVLCASAADLCTPSKIAVDSKGNVFVADTGNSRVLEYNTPLTTDTIADKVFGQGDFTGTDCNLGGASPTASTLCVPIGVAVDGAGNLYVADGANNRVLEYNSALTSNGIANAVFGQGGSFESDVCNFDTAACIPTLTSTCPASTNIDLCGPSGVAVDVDNNLYVADGGNDRVLEYNTPLATKSVTADTVFGQGGSFTSNVCDFDIGIVNDVDASTANDLCSPHGVAVDGAGNLYIADFDNNRVLEYNTPLSSGTTATGVLGQLDFTHEMENLTDAQGLYDPEDVAIDTSSSPNHVYVSDFTNNRILGWNNAGAFASGAAADLVIGQPDFLSYLCDGANGMAVSASTLCDPEGIAVDGSGNLYVADSSNNRVLEFATPFTACKNTFPCVGGGATVVLGQGPSFASNDENSAGLSAGSLASPVAVAADASGNLYVVDSGNNRVLEYNAPVMTGAAAATVFGQGASGNSFASNACNFDTGGFGKPSSAVDLCGPAGIALDTSGNLYLSDSNNHRVLEYNTPLNPGSGEPGAGDTTADNVFGQGGSFTSNKCNNDGTLGVSAGSLCTPAGLTVDGSGNVYLADAINNRVLEYNTPLTTDTIADHVFGTCGSFSKSACSGIGADSLDYPTGVAVDGSGKLYIADSKNNRVLAYDQPLTSGTPTATATATPTATVTATASATGTIVATGTPTLTATTTASATAAPTAKATATVTATATQTATPTPTSTPSGPPNMVVRPKSLALSAAPSATASVEITISNTGTGMLIANVSAPHHNPPLSETGGGNNIAIAPSTMHPVTITFAPTRNGSITDGIVITSNDPAHRKPIKVKIRGRSK